MTSLEDIELALNELRLLVLLECEDGKFRQVKLSPERFKVVSGAAFSHEPVEGQPEGLRENIRVDCIHCKGDWEIDADTFLGLASHYDDADECDEKDTA